MSFQQFRDAAGDFVRVALNYLGFIDDDEITRNSDLDIGHILKCIWLAFLHGIMSLQLAHMFALVLG